MRMRTSAVDNHPCGCITRFDTIAWHSVTIVECDEHRRHREFHEDGPIDPRDREGGA